ncbi:MAG: 2,3-bisphosphoglycerate-independent phosphoglycerate mutase [Oligoflexales bacterium]|nr:2,3-bisphosphoglycerate-independent phosphoglycerate mutase [Oligoflexales bacterium]
MQVKQRVLVVIMDGVGARKNTFGNAVALAHTPYLDYLSKQPLSTTLKAHGTYVGLPSNKDIGNSEVGHNTFGAGRSFAQGATLVQNVIDNGSLFKSPSWKTAIGRCHKNGTLHFLGLLSDGNVHSHEDHLYAMLKQAENEGAKRIRVHALLDGRDVSEKSAEKYAERLESVLSGLREKGCDAKVASGGGRMHITMDRYGADWPMVARGWDVHVKGKGPLFPSLSAAISHYREDPSMTDQYIPGFCIGDKQASGTMNGGDSVIFFNFRGDRAIEISKAFEDEEFNHFDRGPKLDIFYAGMMEYDGDLHIPNNYLVTPPEISNTLSEYLVSEKVKQFACSETQKFGHVTYFWNGNRSGYFDKGWEEYLEIPSDTLPFDLRPWMKAAEITETTIARLKDQSFDFGRINLANGDMVGHTGSLEAAVIAMSTVDQMLGRLIKACSETKTTLVVTADHGNCDEMFEGKEADFPQWEEVLQNPRPKPKTSHTLAEVPFYIYDPNGQSSGRSLLAPGEGTIANLANTCLDLLGVPSVASYAPSLIVS